MLALLAVALLGFSSYVVLFDYANRENILPGTRVAGSSVGGLSIQKAEDKLTQELAYLGDPMVLRDDAYTWRLPVRNLVSIPVEKMIARGHRLGQKKSIWERTYRRWFQQPLELDIPLSFSLDQERLATYVSEVAKEIDRDPVDATIDVSSGVVRLLPSQTGKRLEQRRAAKEIAELLPTRNHFYHLPVKDLPPQKTIDDFSEIILINQSTHTLLLYNREQPIKTYPIAVGMPQYPTPAGSFKIIRKRVNPTWYNPRSEWSADMPLIIPPGPDNPLGSRAMDLNTPGIRIHGTPNERSIGFSVSHGCIRMKMRDAEDLFSQVEVGTPVEIIR
jgi:lipoprotein-anchoring transpeptidase ErfK/SrfK